MPLVPQLRAEAVRRGLFPDDTPLRPEWAFTLVRDMPYERASDRQPETVIREWRGTCSGKHYLLQALFDELGLDTMLLLATHEFTPENSPWLPPHLLEVVREAPVPDVHTFLRVRAREDWGAVDATWPLAARDLGLPVNVELVLGRNLAIAADIEELFDVPEDEDAQVFKERVIAMHVGPPGSPEPERRDRFIEDLGAWLAESLGSSSERPS